MASQCFLSLNDGSKMPVLGLNTWNINVNEVNFIVKEAIQLGYRCIDTSLFNFNERLIGNALKEVLKEGKVKRTDLFITSKLPPTANKPENVQAAILESLTALQLEYVDLYLVHAPITLMPDEKFDAIKWNKDGTVCLDNNTNHVQVWKRMEDLVLNGLAKSIGLANFNRKQIDLIIPNCTILPAVLQIEHHIYLQQPELIRYCKNLNIGISAYGPLGSYDSLFSQRFKRESRDLPNLLTVPEVQEIAKKHKKTEAQVLIRWNLENNIAVVLRMTNSRYMREILDTNNFSLCPEDVAKLNALDRNFRYVTLEFMRGAEQHPEYPF